MEVYVHGRLSATLYKTAFVGTEEQIKSLLNRLLDNLQKEERPDDVFALAEKLYVSSESENTIDLKCFMWGGLGQFWVKHHACGLYCAILMYQSSLHKLDDLTLIELQKQTGVEIITISTGTYQVGYGGAEVAVVNGELVEDYDSYQEIAYALYCRRFCANRVDGFLELMKDSSLLAKDVKAMIHRYQTLAFPEPCEEEDAEGVAYHYLFDCHEGSIEDLTLLGILCAGLDDRDYAVDCWSQVDELIQQAESTQAQTSGMLLRLVHKEGLTAEAEGVYRKTLKRRKKTATALALQSDRDHWLEKLIELEAVYEPQEQIKMRAVAPRCVALLKKTFAKKAKSTPQLTGQEKRVEIFRNLEEGEILQILNHFDHRKPVVLLADGTVKSPYPELSEWKDLCNIYCIGGMLVGLKRDGTLYLHRTNDNAHLAQMEHQMRGWTDITSLATNLKHPFNYSSGLKTLTPADCYCVGLKRDGTVISCGKNLVGEKVAANWPAAKQVFVDKNSYGIVTQDGRIRAFGRVSFMDGLKNVLQVESLTQGFFIVHLANGLANYYMSKDNFAVGLKKLMRFGTAQWVASCEAGFHTNHEYDGYRPCADELHTDVSVRLRKYGEPVDYVCLNNTENEVLAALYEDGNVRLFTAGRKAGEIIAKKVLKIEAENGRIFAYSK